MKRHRTIRVLLGLLAAVLIATSCGSDDSVDSVAAATCPADDPDCLEGLDSDAAAPLPTAIALGDPDEGPASISFGGFFYSDGETSQLCSALAESFPPQCGTVVIDIEAPLDVVLEHVAESFGSPDDAKVNIESGIYWTDDWINLTGTLQADRLVLE